MADEMGRRLGQPMVVENRAGASGIVGASYVAKAPADGYTVMFTTTLPIMTNQFVYAKLPYDPRKDFALISQVATGHLVMAVHPSVQAKSVKDFVAWAQHNKGKVNYGSWGVGSAAHLMGAFLSNSRNMDMSHIAYKGEAPMLQDLIGGQVQMAIGSYMSIKPYLESGKLRALAVTGDKRIDGISDVPTFQQAGLTEPEFRPVGWLVLVRPRPRRRRCSPDSRRKPSRQPIPRPSRHACRSPGWKHGHHVGPLPRRLPDGHAGARARREDFRRTGRVTRQARLSGH